ncbi:10638_t:CDS:2, partial [Ambispora gerdemannii]
VLPLDDLIVRLLLMASEEGKTEQSSTVISLMPELKQTFDSNLTLSALNKCLLKLGGSGTAPRKISAAYGFTPAQRRKIIFGVLTWLNEIIQPKLDEANYSNLDGYLAESSNFKVLTERILPMLNSIKENSENFKPLSVLLVHMHKLNPDLFEEILYTYDQRIIQTVGGIVGWEDELISGEREIEHAVHQFDEDIALMPQEPEQALRQQEMQKRLYEEQLVSQQQQQLLQQQEIQKQTIENHEQEFDTKNPQNSERLLLLELEKRREWELQQQKQQELEIQRIELEKLREWDLQQREFEEQRQRELKEQEQQQQRRELKEQEQQRQLEIKQKQELQKKRELEEKQKREWELAERRQRELQQKQDLQKQREQEQAEK